MFYGGSAGQVEFQEYALREPRGILPDWHQNLDMQITQCVHFQAFLGGVLAWWDRAVEKTRIRVIASDIRTVARRSVRSGRGVRGRAEHGKRKRLTLATRIVRAFLQRSRVRILGWRHSLQSVQS